MNTPESWWDGPRMSKDEQREKFGGELVVTQRRIMGRGTAIDARGRWIEYPVGGPFAGIPDWIDGKRVGHKRRRKMRAQLRASKAQGSGGR